MGHLYHGYVKLPEGILAMENKKWKMAKSWQYESQWEGLSHI